MKTKQLNKYIDKYRNLYTGDKEKYLRAYKEANIREHEITADKRAFVVGRKKWLMASAIVLIAIIALIVPVVVLMSDNPINDEDVNQIYYCSNEQITNVIIEDIDSYKEEHNIVLKPLRQDVLYIGYVQLVLKDNNIIGVLSEVTVFEEDIITVDVIEYISNYIIENQYFDTFQNVKTINGIDYKYNFYNDSELKYAIEFMENGRVYRLFATCEYEVDIESILSRIFI